MIWCQSLPKSRRESCRRRIDRANNIRARSDLTTWPPQGDLSAATMGCSNLALWFCQDGFRSHPQAFYWQLYVLWPRIGSFLGSLWFQCPNIPIPQPSMPPLQSLQDHVFYVLASDSLHRCQRFFRRDGDALANQYPNHWRGRFSNH